MVHERNLSAIHLRTPGHMQQILGQIRGGKHLKMYHSEFWQSAGRLHVLGNALCLFTQCNPLASSRKIPGKPCTVHIRAREPSAEHVRRSFLHTDINTKEKKKKEEKRKFCPYRKGIADRDGECFTLAHSVLSLSFGQCSNAIDERSWGFRIFLQEF